MRICPGHEFLIANKPSAGFPLISFPDSSKITGVIPKKGNVADKKALSDAGMKVGKVNSALQKHFQGVGATMSKEWAERAGSRGAAVLAAYK